MIIEHVDLDGGRWQLGDLIGSGGFARVHEAESPKGEPAVLKLVPKHPGAEREALLEELTGTPNVIPILDTGEHGDHWVLAMPRAKMSLRDHLERHGRLEPDDAKPILVDIANALIALDGRVVHRDLKPENVLRWDGAWCLADKGNPVMLPPGRDAGGALSNVATSWQIAWSFTPIDQDDSAEFIERWQGWFADAIEGKLRYPSSMPERDPSGSYRT